MRFVRRNKRLAEESLLLIIQRINKNNYFFRLCFRVLFIYFFWGLMGM